MLRGIWATISRCQYTQEDITVSFNSQLTEALRWPKFLFSFLSLSKATLQFTETITPHSELPEIALEQKQNKQKNWTSWRILYYMQARHIDWEVYKTSQHMLVTTDLKTLTFNVKCAWLIGIFWCVVVYGLGFFCLLLLLLHFICCIQNIKT